MKQRQKPYYLRITLIFMFVLILGFVRAQDKFNLEYKYKKGNTYHYKADLTMETTQEMMGKEFKSSGSGFSRMKIIVTDVLHGGDISFIESLEEMRTRMKSDSPEMKLDTTIERTELIGKRTGIIISKFGEIKKTTTIDTARMYGIDLGLGDLSGSAINATEMMFKLPDHEIRAGDKWNSDKNDSTGPSAIKMHTKTHMEYTLAGREKKNGHDCVKINFTGKIELNGQMNQMEMDMSMEGTGDQKGSYWFDPVLGLLIAGESTATQDITLAMTGQMSMTIPMTQTIKTIFTLIE